MWQEAAREQWLSRLQARVDVRATGLIREFSEPLQWTWLMRLQGENHPVAQGMAAWLSRMETRPWVIAPDAEWDIQENAAGVLFAYPEYLGWDPVAMCGLASLWAGGFQERWDAATRHLGPLVVVGACQGHYTSPGLTRRRRSFDAAYSAYLQRWGCVPEPHLDDAQPPLPNGAVWPSVPDYRDYAEQLAFGVVPHRVGGRGVTEEISVLLALAEIEDDRAAAAGLAFKALEGLWLTRIWEGAAPHGSE